MELNMVPYKFSGSYWRIWMIHSQMLFEIWVIGDHLFWSPSQEKLHIVCLTSIFSRRHCRNTPFYCWKEQVQWSGELNEPLPKVDPREALAAAKSRAHRQGSRSRITAQSNLVVGHGEGRATPELDLIWWSNLYNSIKVGKLAIRIYVRRIEFSWFLCNQHWTVSLNWLKMLPAKCEPYMYNIDGM